VVHGHVRSDFCADRQTHENFPAALMLLNHATDWAFVTETARQESFEERPFLLGVMSPVGIFLDEVDEDREKFVTGRGARANSNDDVGQGGQHSVDLSMLESESSDRGGIGVICWHVLHFTRLCSGA